MLKPKAVLIGVFLVIVVPLWLGFAYAIGIIRIGAEREITRPPLFEQTTTRDRDALSFCLSKNYSGRLSLIGTNPPPKPDQTTRLRNRGLHLVVDVSSLSGGSVVRVFKLNDTALASIHRRAVQSCIPENGFPPAADPRNRDFYSRG